MSFYEQDFEDLTVSVSGHILTVTINRPESHNAITLPMVDSFQKVMSYADFDRQIRVIILTGAGKSFCAGGDIKAMAEKEGMFAGEPNELRQRYEVGIQRIPKVLTSLETPVVAAVNGAAIGAGLDLACMCDLRICSSKAKFGETVVKLGLVPGDGGGLFVQRVVGLSKAMEMSLTGRIYQAEAALAMGLVSEVVEGDVVAAAEKLVAEIAANAPVAVRLTKKAIYQACYSPVQEHLQLAASWQGIAQRTEDHFEGLKAMTEKRKPEFSGY